MYRILIVDDEPYAVEYLIELLSEHMEIDAYKAYSGKEALALLAKTRMDIVFTDIRMPGMDGMELTRFVLDEWPETQVVILTGYGDYKMLYDLQKMKNVTYLVKTDEPQAIINAAQDAAHAIDESIRYDELLSSITERHAEYVRLKQQEYLLGLTQGRAQPPSAEMFSELQLQLDPARRATLAVMRFSGGSAALVAEMVHRSVEARFLAAHAVLSTDTVLFFFQPKAAENSKKQVDIFLNGALEMAQNRCRQHLNAAVTFAVSDDAWALMDAGLPLPRLLALLQREDTPRDAERVLRLTDTVAEEALLPARPQQIIQVRELENLYAKRDRAGFAKLLDAILEAAEAGRLPFDRECELYYAIVLVFLQIINAGDIADSTALDTLLALKPLAWRQIRRPLETLSTLIFEAPESDPSQRLVSAIELYVRENIGFGLTLVSIASHFHFNPSYLSRMYKKIRGNTLSNYITGQRIQLAKEMLRQHSTRVSEIAVLLGYETATYFCHLFKKMTGSTPQEYRDSFGNR